MAESSTLHRHVYWYIVGCDLHPHHLSDTKSYTLDLLKMQIFTEIADNSFEMEVMQ